MEKDQPSILNTLSFQVLIIDMYSDGEVKLALATDNSLDLISSQIHHITIHIITLAPHIPSFSLLSNHINNTTLFSHEFTNTVISCKKTQ